MGKKMSVTKFWQLWKKDKRLSSDYGDTDEQNTTKLDKTNNNIQEKKNFNDTTGFQKTQQHFVKPRL